MKKVTLFFSIILFSAQIVGCNDQEAISKIEKDVIALREEQKSTSVLINESLIPYINKRFSELPDNTLKILSIERRLEAHKTLVLDFSEKGYGKLETSSGFFLLMIDDVKPYADGVKIVLRIGNPLAGEYSGFKMYAKYGPREPEFPKDLSASDSLALWYDQNEKWKSEIQEAELSFSEPLLPGAWNKSVMILPKIKESDLGYLELTMETDSISLIKAK